MKKFLDCAVKHLLLPKDVYNREISYVLLNNVFLIGKNLFYPNVLLHTNNETINPYDEKIMSLKKESFYDDDCDFTQFIHNKPSIHITEPVFFFIYHFDNYYHFLYDTIPYLITYQHLKKKIPNLKLLVQYPNIVKQSSFYLFNTELLSKFINIQKDILLCDSRHLYHKLYVSSSFTHGGLSSLPPCKDIYPLYQSISVVYCKTPSKIYISRRTWIHNDCSNIGTDYTTRRKMMNEDCLVRILKDKYNIQEIFTETLSTDEKINMFRNAELVIGPIGGGMANLLFSPPSTKSIVIVSPYFLDINNRFRYSMEHTNITYFRDVSVYKEMNTIPLYCRVRMLDSKKIGEIEDYKDNQYLVKLSNNDISGFHNNVEFQQCWCPDSAFELIDNGLNSPYETNIKSLCEIINETLSH